MVCRTPSREPGRLIDPQPFAIPAQVRSILEQAMAKPPITKAELIWPGKYTEEGVLAETPRASLPLQTVELHGPPVEWRNKLIWGDNLLVVFRVVPFGRQAGVA